MTKEALRKELLSLRRRVENRGEKDRLIRHRFFAAGLPLCKVLCFVSKGEEVDTLGIILRLFKAHKNVYVPRCVLGTNQMVFCQIQSLEDLEEGTFGLLEPKPSCSILTDLTGAVCLVPGLSFTENGDRIGYGKGYFDRFLHENRDYALRSVGLCYNELIRDTIPTLEKDKQVQMIITDQRVLLPREKEVFTKYGQG